MSQKSEKHGTGHKNVCAVCGPFTDHGVNKAHLKYCANLLSMSLDALVSYARNTIVSHMEAAKRYKLSKQDIDWLLDPESKPLGPDAPPPARLSDRLKEIINCQGYILFLGRQSGR